VNLTVELDEVRTQLFKQAVEDVLGSDTFHADCIGSWAEGLAHRPDANGRLHWLVKQEGADDADEEGLIERFRADDEPLGDLPEGYYHLRYREARLIVSEGLLRHGTDFLDGTTDLHDLGSVVRQILLGESA